MAAAMANHSSDLQPLLAAWGVDYDPTKVIGRLKEPLLAPEGEEREGYVPNVVYTCGVLPVGERLLIPYGISDSAVGFATVKVADLLALMV